MAEIVEFDDIGDKGEIEAVEEAQQQPVKEEPKPDIPEKYRGKSLEDVAKMHQEAEKTLSRQGQELGEVRRLADELLKAQLEKKAEKEKPVEVDYFENPQEAIRQAIQNNPEVIAAKQLGIQAQQDRARQILISKHPDFSQVVQDEGFAAWRDSSGIRKELFNRAQNYDVDAADELLSTYKQLKAVKEQKVAEIDTKARDSALKSAAVEIGGSGESSKKVYRRADLIRLKMRDPNKYEAMSDEIMAAYAEGRIR